MTRVSYSIGTDGARCVRCATRDTATTMSRFNTDIICLPCEQDERTLRTYAHAMITENDAVMNGDRNFEGIGLDADDLETLKALRIARKLLNQP